MSRQVWLWIGLAVLGCRSSADPVPPAASSQSSDAPATEGAAEPSPAPPPAPTTAPTTAPAKSEQLASLRTIELRVGDASGRPVVALHGLGDRPESFQGLFRGYTHPSLVVMPAAPAAYSNGYTWFSSRLRSSPVEVIQGEISAATDRVVALCAEVERTTGQKPAVTGFSQGGVLALAVAVQHPEAVSVSVPLSGWLPIRMVPTEVSSRAVPIRAIHGTADEVLPLAETEAVVTALSETGFDASLKRYEGVGHGLSAEMREQLYAYLSGEL